MSDDHLKFHMTKPDLPPQICSSQSSPHFSQWYFHPSGCSGQSPRSPPFHSYVHSSSTRRVHVLASYLVQECTLTGVSQWAHWLQVTGYFLGDLGFPKGISQATGQSEWVSVILFGKMGREIHLLPLTECEREGLDSLNCGKQPFFNWERSQPWYKTIRHQTQASMRAEKKWLLKRSRSSKPEASPPLGFQPCEPVHSLLFKPLGVRAFGSCGSILINTD